ncbi:MAG TPA: hypothetical protein VN654_06705 [Vicinamibacterales bacterium]|nr:hypothetical protein [Vicinamibacterales bacterium]
MNGNLAPAFRRQPGRARGSTLQSTKTSERCGVRIDIDRPDSRRADLDTFGWCRTPRARWPDVVDVLTFFDLILVLAGETSTNDRDPDARLT